MVPFILYGSESTNNMSIDRAEIPDDPTDAWKTASTRNCVVGMQVRVGVELGKWAQSAS